MKQLIFALACVIATGSFTVNAQMVNVAATSDSTVVIDKVYAGILAGSNYLIEQDTFTSFTSLRAGVSALWKVTPKFTLRTFTAGEYEAVSGSSYAFHAMWLQYTPGKFSIEAGKGPTLVAKQHRPFPVSLFGQFETWTQAQLPGVAYTLNLKYSPQENLLFGGGVSLRNDMPEYQVTTTIGKLQLSGYHQTFNGVTGGAVTFTSKHLFSTSFVNTNAVGSFSSVTLSTKQSLYFFNDFGYDRKQDKVVRWGSGFSKIITMKRGKGILAIAYTYENHGLNLYTLIGL